MTSRKLSIRKIIEFWEHELKEAVRQEDNRKIKHSANMLTYWNARLREEDGKRLDEEKGRRSC